MNQIAPEVRATDVNLLEVSDLRTYIHTRRGVIRAVDGVSFTIGRGESLGLVGESGSGKSITCQSIVRLEPRPAAVIERGKILLEGEDILQRPIREMRHIRGSRIGMIMQDPLNSLNPVFTIGNQLIEALRLSNPGSPRSVLRDQAREAMERVGIARAGERLDSYPFEFSGGMRQRVAAAIAMVRRPDLLIADEPTTALDVTTQDQFLALLEELRSEYGMSLLLVSHDLAIVAETCDRVAVMYAGRVVETGVTGRVFSNPKHPYTQALMDAIPHLAGPRMRRLFQISGEPPHLIHRPSGCRFAPRCVFADQLCRTDYPPELRYRSGDSVACWRNASDTTAQQNRSSPESVA